MSENVQGRALAIMMEAIEKPEAQRLEFVQAACDSAGLLREVLSLMASHARAGDFLGSPTPESLTLAPDAPLQPWPAAYEGPGAKIGRYKLLQLIGEGGFGSVFMAEQEHPVRRRVALKIIKLGMDTRQVIARFEAERQALAMMDHAHIARVFDAGATDTGRPYFVMELVRGVPITDYCDSNKLSTRERLELFTPVCNAVQHAHQKGVIHRDIKPGNVMVTLADGKPVPKVIDFGIAKAADARLTEKTCFTEYRQFIGTPQYMSPEQAEMTGMDIDTRSDIYSLGVLLYELLTGTTPLDSKELRSLAHEEIRRTIREVEPLKPSTRLSGLGETAMTVAQHRKTEPRKLGQLLRGELDWIVMRALEKDRTRRYDTAGNLAADIRRHLDNEPVLARPPSAAYGMRKFVSKHRAGVLAGMTVLTALLAGSALAMIGFIRAEYALKSTEAARRDAQLQRDTADRERVEAQLQKANADGQKEVALLNARRAELRFAEGLISQADALSLAGRLSKAHQLYVAAYKKFVELHEPLAAAEAGLWNSYLQTTFPLLSFGAGDGPVNCVAISPDGRTALSAGSDTLKLWDLKTGRELLIFTGHTSPVRCLAVSPDGKTALTGCDDGTLRAWDLASGKAVSFFVSHADTFTDDPRLAETFQAVASVAIAPDGLTALSGSIGGTLVLWDLASGKERLIFAGQKPRTFNGQRLFLSSVAIAPDGRTAISAERSALANYSRLSIWDMAKGTELRSFTAHDHGQVTQIVISPDSRTALSSSSDNTVKRWDIASGSALGTLAGHSDRVLCVAISPDGRTALSGAADQTLKLWDLTTGTALRAYTGHASAVCCVAISPDGQTALSGGDDSLLKLWGLGEGRDLRRLGDQQEVSSVAIAPDGRTALSGSWDSTLRLWDLASGKELHVFAGHSDKVTSVAIAPNGLAALSGGFDKTLKLWDLAGGREPVTLTGHASHVTSAAIAPDGRTALSGSDDMTLRLWDLTGATQPRVFKGHADPVKSVAIAPDGRTALSGGAEESLKLWDLKGVQEPRTLQQRREPDGDVLVYDPVQSIAIARDGRTALSGGYDGTLKLWELPSGTLLRALTGHTKEVTGIAIAPDGRTALSASSDQTLKLWDLASGNELRTFISLDSARCVAIASDGPTVLSGGKGGMLLRDFARGPAELAFESRVAGAQAALRQSPNDPKALQTLGEWYAFRGVDRWAVDLLTLAQRDGAPVAPLTLARCYWELNENDDARRQFTIALEQSKDPAERTWIGWCIASIDSELNRKSGAQRSSEPSNTPDARTVGDQDQK